MTPKQYPTLGEVNEADYRKTVLEPENFRITFSKFIRCHVDFNPDEIVGPTIDMTKGTERFELAEGNNRCDSQRKTKTCIR